MTKENSVSFPDEFVGSIYTKKLRGGLAKAKANLGEGIIQIVQTAKKGITMKNKKKRHIMVGTIIRLVLLFRFIKKRIMK